MRHMTTIKLPFPPSVNHYWRQVKGRTILSAAGRKYQEAVKAACFGLGIRFGDTQLDVSITAHLPDNRQRDLDNLLKAPLDAMAKAGLYENDCQIKSISIRAATPCRDGLLEITLQPIQGPQEVHADDIRTELANRAKELQSELEAILKALDAVSK